MVLLALQSTNCSPWRKLESHSFKCTYGSGNESSVALPLSYNDVRRSGEVEHISPLPLETCRHTSSSDARSSRLRRVCAQRQRRGRSASNMQSPEIETDQNLSRLHAINVGCGSGRALQKSEVITIFWLLRLTAVPQAWAVVKVARLHAELSQNAHAAVPGGYRVS